MPVPPFVAGSVLTAAQLNTGAYKVGGGTSPGTATTYQLDNVFSASFRHYRIFVSGYSATAGNFTVQLCTGGTAAATTYYWNMITRNYNAANAESNSAGSTTNFFAGLLNNGTSTAYSNLVIDVLDPFAASPTGFNSMNNYNTTSSRTSIGTHYVSTSYDGIKFGGAGNLNINVAIYGFVGA